jgi:hypothetical protein
MPFLYIFNYINIINITNNINLAILSKTDNYILNKLIQNEQTSRLNYHGLIEDYVKGLNKYEISYEKFNFIMSNYYKKDIINIIFENNSIYYTNINKNIKIEIFNSNIYMENTIIYTDVDIYM